MLKSTNISGLSDAEQQRRLRGTEHWYHAGQMWASVSMAQVIRSKLSASEAQATLYFIPALDTVLNRPDDSKITDADMAKCVAAFPNMNHTGKLPAIAMLHIGMRVRLTHKLVPPDAVPDTTGTVISIEFDEMDEAKDTTRPPPATRILWKLPLAVIVKLDDTTTEFLPPRACRQHSFSGPQRDCQCCDFRKGCFAVVPQKSRTFTVQMPKPGSDTSYDLKVQRTQVPLTISNASTLQTLQGVTAEPGLICHWSFPRQQTQEHRWLATYVALSRPPSFKQLISVGLPKNLRDIIEDGPPEGILSRYAKMFEEIESSTHLHADELLKRFGWV